MELLGSIRHSVRQLAVWFVARMQVDSERGASAVEYGIMAMLIASVVIVAVVFLGNETSETFSCTASSLAGRSNNC